MYPVKAEKPPLSFTQLITMAINSTDRKRASLPEIYKWISTTFPYYKMDNKIWKVIRKLNNNNVFPNSFAYPLIHTNLLNS